MDTKRFALGVAGSALLLSGCLHDWSRVGLDAAGDRGPDVTANDGADTIDAPDAVDAIDVTAEADATDVADGRSDVCIAMCDGGCCDAVNARPWAPWNGGVAGSRTPTLRWTMPPGVTQVVVEHCPGRTCLAPMTLYTGTDDHYTLPTTLTRGDTYYWRVSSTVGTSTSASSVFEFEVGGYGPDTTVGLGSDFNGDGDADLLVGSPDDSAPGTLFYYQARAGGAFPPTPNNMFMAPVTPPVDSVFAQSLSLAGDLNGDGYVDLAIGQSCRDPFATCGASSAADAFVFFTPFGILTDFLHVTVSEGGADERFGRVVAGLGDIDGDGFADVAVGAPNFGAPVTGAVYVYRGGAMIPTPISLDHGTEQGAFGSAIAGGDIDGDGRAEIVVGTPDFNGGQGRVSVYHWNGSGFDRAILPPSEGSVPRNRGRSVAVIGDVDGDGFAEIAVGEPTPSGVGRVTIYYGEATVGMIARNMQINSAVAGDHLGLVVSRVGDFNGDGSPDVAIGSPAGPTPMVQVVGISSTMTGMTHQTFMGGSASGFGSAIAPLGDVNGDGRGDLAIGSTNGTSVTIVQTSTSGAATTSTVGPVSGHNRYGAALAIQ